MLCTHCAKIGSKWYVDEAFLTIFHSVIYEYFNIEANRSVTKPVVCMTTGFVRVETAFALFK